MFEARVLSRKSEQELVRLLSDIGCDVRGIDIMAPKGVYHLVVARDLDPRAANIVKQEFLSAGGEVAVSWSALNLSEESSQILMMGTKTHYRIALKKLEEQPFDLPELAEEVNRAIDSFTKPKPFPLTGERRTHIMGIINVTPDSFYGGGKLMEVEAAVEEAKRMEEMGADVIDVGGESTRPGSESIPVEEEISRIVPVIEQTSSEVDIPISVDTYKPEVAEAAVDAGCDMINDIYALRKDGMGEMVAQLDVPVVLMHMQGTPKTMQEAPFYEDVIGEIYSFLNERASYAVDVGIAKEKIIIDPGIGFGKRLEDNLEIINRLEEFNSMGYPILLGASRKSFLGEILNKDAEERLFGTLGISAAAVQKNASVLRVHDVSENLDVVKAVEALKRL